MVITPPSFKPAIDVLKIQTNVVAVNDIGFGGGSWGFQIGEAFQ
jgi:hypothetical protein